MKIKTKKELSRFSSLLCQILKDVGVGVRLNTLQSYIAEALGFNTYNGMIFSFPNQHDISPQFIQMLSVRLKKHRGYTLSNAQLTEACSRVFSPKCFLGSFNMPKISRSLPSQQLGIEFAEWGLGKSSFMLKMAVEHFRAAEGGMQKSSESLWNNFIKWGDI